MAVMGMGLGSPMLTLIAVQGGKIEGTFLNLIKNDICIIFNKILIRKMPAFTASTDTAKLCSVISAYA